MKIRIDFVSNSSSSSFIVKDEPGLDAIYKEESFTWTEFCNRWLYDYLFEDFKDACNSYYYGRYVWWSLTESRQYDVRQHVTYVVDDEFIKMFKTNRRPCLQLPESFKQLGKELCDAIMTARSISTLSEPHFWTAGMKDKNLAIEFVHKSQNIRNDIINNNITVKLSKVQDWLISKVENECKNWNFWYAELSDSDDSEQKGKDGLSDVSWYMVFSNH